MGMVFLTSHSVNLFLEIASGKTPVKFSIFIKDIFHCIGKISV